MKRSTEKLSYIGRVGVMDDWFSLMHTFLLEIRLAPLPQQIFRRAASADPTRITKQPVAAMR